MPRRSVGAFKSLLLSLLILAGALLVSRAQDGSAQIKLEDIKILYHGLPLDEARRPIDVARDDLPRLYRDLARKAFEATPAESAVSKAVVASQVLVGLAVPESSPGADTADDDISKFDFISDILIDDSKESPNFPSEYEGYLRILRSLAGLKQFGDIPGVEDSLRGFLDEYQARNRIVYQSCSDPDVPTPPGYASDLWKRERVELQRKHSLTLYGENDYYHPTEIYFYRQQDIEPKGLCALLKRYHIADKVTKAKKLWLVGVICEGDKKTAGESKSCFWEWPSEELTEKQLESDLYSGISTTWPNSNAGIKNELCTSCHTGNNAFIFYKGTELCYNDVFKMGGSGSGSACYGDGDGWSVPIGNALPHGSKTDFGSANKCARCHDLGTITNKVWYCGLLKFVTGRVMPPGADKEGLSWEGPSAGNPYEESVAQLREFCK